VVSSVSTATGTGGIGTTLGIGAHVRGVEMGGFIAVVEVLGTSVLAAVAILLFGYIEPVGGFVVVLACLLSYD
jgi:hypothetical protein